MGGVEAVGKRVVPLSCAGGSIPLVGVSTVFSSNNFSLPARRRAASIGAIVVLAAGALVLSPVSPAHATGDHGGKATAVVLRTGLDVSLLNASVQVPLAVSLNDVKAPADADRTALSADLNGVNQGKPFSVFF